MSSYRAYKRISRLDDLAQLGLNVARDLERRVCEARSLKEKLQLAKLFADIAGEATQATLLARELECEGREEARARERRAPDSKTAEPSPAPPLKLTRH